MSNGNGNSKIRISEFANICKTTSRTIRFYDNIGILKADYIDPSSGYRYYAKEKVLEFHKITSLKQIGFTIEEIRTALLDASDSDILEILREKAKSLSDAHEHCVKTISEYEERVKMYNEKTDRVNFVKDTETNTILISGGDISTTVRCLAKDLDPCYNMLWSLVSAEGYINLDFADVCCAVDPSQIAQVGYGSAKGENKGLKAAEEACKNLSKASRILFGATVSRDVTLEDMKGAANKIIDELDGKNATVIWGVILSDDIQDQFDITVMKFD